MEKKIELKNFDLQKIKMGPKKALHIEWYDSNKPNDLFSIDSQSLPSDDLVSKLEAFNEIMAYSLGLNFGWDFARENNRKNDEKLKEAVNFWNEEIERCNVSGVVYVGTGELSGIKITGSLKCELGAVGLASPKIRFDEEEIGIGEKAEILAKELKDEVYLFIYKGKRGNDLFNDDVKKEDASGLNTLKIAQ